MRNRVLLWVVLMIIVSSIAHGRQPADSSEINKKRLNTALIGTGAVYTAGLVVLAETWYKEQGTTSFHFFNDNAQWNQVDKLGHFYSAYQLSRIGKQLFLWTNMSEKKSAIWGSVLSQALMIPLEINDGFAVEYGFSWGDIAANLLGSGFFLAQELGWQKQLIKSKFSFHTTGYAPLRPEVLGNGFMEELIKDYNGHTYWFSFDIYAMAGSGNKLPSWLNIALGYGAEGMVYAREDENNRNCYSSYRQYYLGLDLDLSHIKTRSKFVNSVLFFVDMIKAPCIGVFFIV